MKIEGKDESSDSIFSYNDNKIIDDVKNSKTTNSINSILNEYNSAVLEEPNDISEKKVTKLSNKLNDEIKNLQNSPTKCLLINIKNKLDEVKNNQNKMEPHEVISKIGILKLEFSMALQRAALWDSDQILSKKQILAFANDYSNKENSLSKSVENFATDVTSIKSENLSITQFASRTLGLGLSQLLLKKVEPGLTSGASGDPVFLIFNKTNNKLSCVIKVKNDIDQVKDEVNGIRLMNHLDTQSCNFIKLMGIGTCHQPEGERYFLAQTVAPGKPLDHYVKDVGTKKGKEREIAFEGLKEIMATTAKALADLHHCNSSQKENDSKFAYQDTVSNYIDQMNSCIGVLEKNPIFSEFNFNKLKDATDASFLETGSFTHEDFHLGNVFYDNGNITVIDNDMIVHSADKISRDPIGVGTYDFAYFHQWIAVTSLMEGLSPKEANDLQNIFKTQYIDSRSSAGPQLSNEVNFMQAFITVKYLVNLTQVLKHPDHPWMQSLGEPTINFLISHLSDGLSHFT